MKPTFIGQAQTAHPSLLTRMGTPLFATETNEHLSSRTLASSFKVATGGHHTPHIVRTLVHDALAKHGAYGSELARILCGKSSPVTAKSFEIHAVRVRFEKVQEILAHIQSNTTPDKGDGNHILSWHHTS